MDNAGALISRIQDIVHTGSEGYTFSRFDTGMTDVLRPSLYGAQHPLILVGKDQDLTQTQEVIVVGHCCESGDILTPATGDAEALQPRKLHKADLNDYLVIEGVGAYCSAMCTRGYNSFPMSPEVLRKANGSFQLIRKKQDMTAQWADEI